MLREGNKIQQIRDSFERTEQNRTGQKRTEEEDDEDNEAEVSCVLQDDMK